VKNHFNHSQLKREVGLSSATLLVIANMVGTGIFTTSGFVMKELGDPLTMLLCWLAGGIFALSGALCYGELGAMFPRAGGEYVFLRESFGKSVAFLSGWISLIVGFSAPIAAAAIAFATYTSCVIPGMGKSSAFIVSMGDFPILTLSPVTVLASLMILIFSFIHYHSLALGTRVQNGLTLFKIGFLVFFIAAGFCVSREPVQHFVAGGAGKSLFGESFAIALIFVSFAYSGWNAATYLGGEIEKPGRNIPVALCAGAVAVTGLYLLLNMVFIQTLSPEKMTGAIDVGAQSAMSLFGDTVGRYFGGVIAIGLLSVLSAMIMTGPRVYYAMSRDGMFFKLFGKTSSLRRTPAYSIFFQGTVSVLMVLTASFENLLLYIGFTLSFSAMLTVIGMVKLRFTRTMIERPCKTFGYPVTPVLFIAGNLWIIFFSITSRPVTSFYGLVTIATGLLLYAYFSYKRKMEAPLPCILKKGETM